MGVYLDIAKENNCSALFLMPLYRIGIERLKKHGFINTYLDDVFKEDISDGRLYFLFKPPDMYEFGNFLEEENERHAYILEDYDSPPYVIVVYKLPEEWKDDYQLFYEGKYSRFSKEYKNMFPKIVTQGGIPAASIQWAVFEKAPALKEEWESEIGIELEESNELWESPRFDREVLNINEILKKEL